MTIALVLAVLWLLGAIVVKVASGVIHLLLLVAVLAVIAHFVRKRAPRV